MAKDNSVIEIVDTTPYNADFEKIVLADIISNENLIVSVVKFLKPEVFYIMENSLVYKAISNLYKNDEPINLITVVEQLKRQNDLEKVGGAYYVSSLESIFSTGMQIDYNVRILYEYYLRREIVKLNSKYSKIAYDLSKDIVEFIEKQSDEIDKLLRFKKSQTDFKTYIKDSYNIITAKRDGKSLSYWQLHDDNLASKIGLKPGSVVLIPSDKGAGKTSFMTYIIDGILVKNKNISVLWFSLEDSIHAMICKFISMRTNLSTKQINSENYTLTENDNKNINKAIKDIENFNIEFVDESHSILEIQKAAKRFAEKNEGNDIVIVIDNFGLIDQSKMTGNWLDNEKEIVKRINYIRQETKACILIPHHITKDAISKTNFKDGYRIRDEHVKGAGEIINYFPQVLSIVRPGKYSDILSAYNKTVDEYIPITEPFSMSTFMKYMWSINPDGDIQDSYTLMTIAINRHENTSNGDLIDFDFIVNAYKGYIKSINNINMSRDDKYKSKAANIEKYMRSKMYMQNTDDAMLPFDDFYYGNTAIKPNIKDVFIVEIIRDRYGSNEIFRYSHKLKYNQFYPF